MVSRWRLGASNGKLLSAICPDGTGRRRQTHLGFTSVGPITVDVSDKSFVDFQSDVSVTTPLASSGGLPVGRASRVTTLAWATQA
jgi:hypothetical protein